MPIFEEGDKIVCIRPFVGRGLSLGRAYTVQQVAGASAAVIVEGDHGRLLACQPNRFIYKHTIFQGTVN